MLADYPVFYVARLVLETRTPLSIATGRGNGVFDSLLVRDANGLPAIPGSSFAGVLRHLYQQACGEDEANALFGYARRSNQEDDTRDKPSQVHVSWGCIHDSQDRPVTALTLPADLQKDLLLADALQATPVLRQHVCLSGRGAAAKKSGPFNRTSLRAGNRFTIELSLWSDQIEDKRWLALLELLNHPAFRLGGATRRGLGALRVERIHQGRFYLHKRILCSRPETETYSDFAAYIRLQAAAFGDAVELVECTSAPQETEVYADISLIPCSGYRFGQGTQSITGDDAKLLAVQEKRIFWENGRGKIKAAPELVIPASSVKGALSHRLTFHYNALCGCFADTPDTPAVECDDNQAVWALFGHAKNDKAETLEKEGKAGRVLLDDVYIAPKKTEAFTLMHNGIDRFTGGVRQHVLFSEELVGQKDALQLRLCFLQPQAIADKKIRQALQKTLEDLTQGRLALGAGGGRGGHGFFSGEIKWSDNGRWIEGKDA